MEHHGKSVCDGYAKIPTHAIHDAVRENAVIDRTTRPLELYLAQHKQRPAIQKHLNVGWETARDFWCCMDASKFTKSVVADAETGKNWESTSDQEMVGMCEDADLVDIERPLRAGHLFCACDPCSLR